jgi:uncharacterized protein
MDRIGEFLETASGRKFYPLDPDPDEVCIEDIATALSNQCRYSGHTRYHYSVATHSYWVAALCPPEAKLWALLHDAAEAYLVDLPRPIKAHSRLGDLYKLAELRVMRAVCDRFGLDENQPDVVSRADRAMLWFESGEVISTPRAEWWNKWKHYADSFGGAVEVRIGPTSPEASRARFLAKFEQLTSEKDA